MAWDAGFCTALVLGLLSVPGIWHLLRGKDPRSTAQSRTLGWMALGGMAGSFYGYHLLDGVADNMHMVLFPHAVLVMPAGIWGLAQLASATRLAMWQRSLSVLAIVLSAVMGLADLTQARDAYQRPWTVSEMEKMKKALGGACRRLLLQIGRDLVDIRSQLPRSHARSPHRAAGWRTQRHQQICPVLRNLAPL